MIYSIKKQDTSDIDLSDYVTWINRVPYISKGRDFSLQAQGYNFGLSSNCPETLQTGDKILFYRDTQIIHLGYVDYVNLDESDMIYTVEVKHILTELQTRNIGNTRTASYPGFKQFIEMMLENKTVISINGVSYDLIKVQDLIDLILAETSGDEVITLDWSNATYFSKDNYTWTVFKAGDSDLTLTTKTKNIDDIYMLPHQVINIGQNGVFTLGEFTNDMYANSITLFDLLSVLFSVLGYYLIVKNKTSFYVVSKKSAPTINDADIYDIQTEEQRVFSTGANCSYGTLNYGLFMVPSFAPYDALETYYEGQIVSYDGKIYRCTYIDYAYYNYTNPPDPGITGISPENPDFWTLIGDATAIKSYIQPTWRDSFVRYEYIVGVKPTYIDWYDNLNLIIIDTDAYITVPVVDTDNTVIMYQKKAKLNSYTTTTITTKASLFIAQAPKDFDNVSISDINNDIIEVEYV